MPQDTFNKDERINAALFTPSVLRLLLRLTDEPVNEVWPEFMQVLQLCHWKHRTIAFDMLDVKFAFFVFSP